MGRVACVPWLAAQTPVQWNTAPAGFTFQNVVNWYNLGTPFASSTSPSTSYYAVIGWTGVASFLDAGQKCPAGDNYVLLEKGDYHLLIDSAAVKTALETEMAATRVRIDAVRSSTLEAAVSQQSVNTTLSLLERDLMGKQSDLFSVGLVASFLVAGFFFGFRFANSASNQ